MHAFRFFLGHQHRPIKLTVAVPLFLLLIVLLAGVPSAVAGTRSGQAPDPRGESTPWIWPTTSGREVAQAFRAPPHAYGRGHRGIDISAPIGTVVRSPADGVVAFRGVVVDRPLITIDHGGGLVTTFEPVVSTLTPGTVISAGDEIGQVNSGGHTLAGQLHVGLRWNCAYINPLLMFEKVPRAVLLPCCD